jgi:hypothetical protein
MMYRKALPVTKIGGNDANTVLLLGSDSMDGSTTFVDNSRSKKTITPTGDTHHEVDQKKFGATSIYFDGTVDALTIPFDSGLSFGTSDFTVDFWMMRNGSNGQYKGIIAGDGNSSSWAPSASSWMIDSNNSTGNDWEFRRSTGTLATTGAIINDGTWYHLSFVRNGNTLKCYVDGIEKSSADVTGLSFTSTSGYAIGCAQNVDDAYHYIGYLDEIRVSPGIARWTSNFTPPTRPYFPNY